MMGRGNAQARDSGRRDDGGRTRPDATALLRRALAGENLTVDRHAHTLHELTQIALALRPGAGLAITDGATMSPIERASVATVGRGRVLFL